MEQYLTSGKLIGEFHADIAHLELISSDHPLNYVGCYAGFLSIPAMMFFLYDEK